MADITKNESRSRWEAVEAGAMVGQLDYHVTDGLVTLTHTEVDRAQAGKGIAGDLVKTALDEIRASGQLVRPVCPYAAAWIDRHPDYADLVHTEWS